MTTKSRFYVYEMRDPRPGKDLQPIYVGKGKGRRAHFHWNKADDHKNPLLRSVFAKIRAADLRPIVEIVHHFDSEAETFQLEIELIAKYGRRELGLGPLCNLTDGGEGGAGSLIHAEHMRKKNADPEFARARDERASEIMQKLNADPAFAKANAERGREALQKLNADPEFAKVRDERSRKRMRKLNADPAFAKAHAERAGAQMQKLNADPAFAKASAERSRERMRKQNADPEFQRRRLAGLAAKRALKQQIQKTPEWLAAGIQEEG